MLKRITAGAAAAALAAVALVGVAAPAIAQSGPQQTAGVTDSTATPGQTITFNSGSGSFTPGSSVQVAVLNSTFTRTAAQNGNVSLTFTVPRGTAPGQYEAVFGSRQVVVPFSVVAAAGTSGSQLPRTGADSVAELTAAGIALVGVGAGMVLVARRRRELVPSSIA